MLFRQTPLIDPVARSITVHGRGGAAIPVEFNNADGSPINVSATSLFFEVDGQNGIRIPLEPGPSSNVRIIEITRAQIAALGVGTRKFSLIDESEDPPLVRWEGRFVVIGYTDAPV